MKGHSSSGRSRPTPLLVSESQGTRRQSRKALVEPWKGTHKGLTRYARGGSSDQSSHTLPGQGFTPEGGDGKWEEVGNVLAPRPTPSHGSPRLGGCAKEGKDQTTKTLEGFESRVEES